MSFCSKFCVLANVLFFLALEAASNSDPPGEVVGTHVVAVSEPLSVPGLSATIYKW